MLVAYRGVELFASILFLLNQQFQDRLYKNIEDIDLVVSAKGSPLQMILSSVYHIDAPTGNIPLDECKIAVLKNPYILKAIPLEKEISDSIYFGDIYAHPINLSSFIFRIMH